MLRCALLLWFASLAFCQTDTAVLLWDDRASGGDANDQESYRTVLEAFGYRVRVHALAQKVSPNRSTGENACPTFTQVLDRQGGADARGSEFDTILVVPRGVGSRLTPAQNDEVLRHLAAGGSVIAEGRQPWLERAGFHWDGRTVAVSSVTDLLYPEMRLQWQGQDPVERFTPPQGARALMVDKESGQVLASMGRHGAGRFLHLAAPLDPHTRDGVSHYPYFPKYLAEAFGAGAPAPGPRLEAYFDPSYRAGADLNRLAEAWRDAGIRTIYIAAWQNHPYAQFIEACHGHGIAVYAWLVFPAGTQKMWDEHPEWRERTAAGTDARVGWRPLLNFQSAACFRAAMDWMKELLGAHEWDGVNISELNYDADFDDYLRPDKFVPMNEDVRRDFRRRGGFDPALLFQPDSPYFHKQNPKALRRFLRYREDIVYDWHRRVLEELRPLRRGRVGRALSPVERFGGTFEVIVTVLDSLHGDYVRPALGVDSARIARLAKEFDFTLQVEDPAHFWAQPPGRYRTFAKAYLKLLPDARRLMFDVNVMADRDVSRTTLPSAVATGTELALTVAAAASVSGRVAIYSEHTVMPQDWELLKTVVAPEQPLPHGRGSALPPSSPD